MKQLFIAIFTLVFIQSYAYRLEIEHEHITIKTYTGFFQSKSLTGSVFSQAYTTRLGKYPFFYSPLKLGIELYDRTREHMTEFQLSNLYFASYKDYGHRKTFSGFGFTYIKTESILHDLDEFIFHPYIGLMTSVNFASMNMKAIREGYLNLSGSQMNIGLHLLLDMAFTIKKRIEMDIKVPLRLIEINSTTVNNNNPNVHSNDRVTKASSVDYLPFNLNFEMGIGWVIL